MEKLGFLMWLVIATTLMGIFVMIVLVVPSLAQHDKELILPAVIAGLVVAFPVAYFVTKQIKAITK